MALDGILVLDKPAGTSSAAAVEHVKRRLGAKRAGHGGTLDPLATGVLPICLGEATKLAQFLLADDKAYEADLALGVETDTLDRTGTVVATRDAHGVTREALLRALAARVGAQDQLPPMFSALKKDGVRLYERARAGEHVEREPRRIRIDRLELVGFWPAAGEAPPRARVAIECSKGTYVRSLVADLGADLGCGAHMTELRRTRSGPFTLAMAHDLDRLDAIRLIPMVEATSLPRVRVPPDLVPRVRSGLQLEPGRLGAPEQEGERFLLLDQDGGLVAVAHVEAGKTVYDRVFVATLPRVRG